MKYRKKPVVIEAIEWTGKNELDVRSFAPPIVGPFEDPARSFGGKPYLFFMIPTMEGSMRADLGDFIIKGIKGEFYPCKPHIFRESYDIAE